MATLSEVQLPRAAPLHKQLLAMEQHHPGFAATWYCDEVVWTGLIQPTERANTYKVRVTYRLGSPPVVDVLEPELKSREPGKPIPHLYKGGHLCLFLPFGFEWDASKLVANTIVPWATLWLHHYEVWRVTGEWLGGGQHPRGRDEGTR